MSSNLVAPTSHTGRPAWNPQAGRPLRPSELPCPFEARAISRVFAADRNLAYNEIVTGHLSKPAVETNKLSEHFRRTDPRFDRRIEVEISAGSARQTASTRNISLGGMFVETLDPLAPHTQVVVRFRVPTQNEAIEISGEVRWLEKGSPTSGMGIRFSGLRAREVWALNRFFQT